MLEEEPQPTIKHCYLVAGLYLVTGDVDEAEHWAAEVWDDWPDEGYTRDVFETYNDDPDLELWFDNRPLVDELDQYLLDGHRVVITYQTGPDSYHAEPYLEPVGIDIMYAYVAGYFGKGV